MRYHGKSSNEKGIALLIALFVLTLTSVFVMSIGSVGIMNLNNQSGYRASVTARYAARAVVAEAIAQAEASSNQGTQIPTYGQSTTDSFVLTLSNNIPATVNFASGTRFSINNMSGTAPMTDGVGDQVPAGYMKINGYATVNGKTAVASALVTLAPDGSYAVLTEGKINASDVTGSVRNNLTATGSNDTIELTSLTGTATSTDPNPDHIDESGTPKGTEITGAAIFPIPDIDVPTLVANQNIAANYQTNNAGFAALVSACGGTLSPSCAALGGKTIVYVDPSDNAGLAVISGSDLSLQNGINVYVNGSLRLNGKSFTNCTVSDPSQANAVFVTGYIDANGASGSNISFIAGGVPTKTQGSDTNNAVYLSGSNNFTGFVYARTGDVDLGNNNNSFTGNIMAKNGELQGSNTDITYSPNYMKAFATELPPNAVRMKATASW